MFKSSEFDIELQIWQQECQEGLLRQRLLHINLREDTKAVGIEKWENTHSSNIYNYKMVALEKLLELPAAFKLEIERSFPGMRLTWMHLDSKHELKNDGYGNCTSKYATVLSVTAFSGTDCDDLDC